MPPFLLPHPHPHTPTWATFYSIRILGPTSEQVKAKLESTSTENCKTENCYRTECKRQRALTLPLSKAQVSPGT